MTAPCPTFGFLVSIEVPSALDTAARDHLRDAWFEFLGSRGLYGTGSGDGALEYVVASESSQATNGDRQAVRAWLGSRREVLGSRVGELIDLG